MELILIIYIFSLHRHISLHLETRILFLLYFRMHFSIDVETTYILIFWSGFFDGCFIIGRSLGLPSQWSQRQRCERGKVWFDSLSQWPSSSPRAIPCPGAHCQGAVSFHLQRDIFVTATDLRDLWVCMWRLLQQDCFVNCWLCGGLLAKMEEVGNKMGSQQGQMPRVYFFPFEGEWVESNSRA